MLVLQVTAIVASHSLKITGIGDDSLHDVVCIYFNFKLKCLLLLLFKKFYVNYSIFKGFNIVPMCLVPQQNCALPLAYMFVLSCSVHSVLCPSDK